MTVTQCDNAFDIEVIPFRIDDAELVTQIEKLLDDSMGDCRLSRCRRSGDQDGVSIRIDGCLALIDPIADRDAVPRVRSQVSKIGVQKGIDQKLIFWEGKAFKQPIPVTKFCDNKMTRKQLIECLAPNRRVTVEVVGRAESLAKPKPEAKPETKPETKPEAKPGAKPEPKPEPKPKP